MAKEKQNVGQTDQSLRIIGAIVATWLGATYNSWWYILTIIFAITAIFRFCLPYKFIGINTNK